MDGADEPADETEAEEENEWQAHEPDDEIDDEVNPPAAKSNRKRRDEESKQVTHIEPLIKMTYQR